MICPLSKITGNKSTCDKEECMFWVISDPPDCLLRIVLHCKFLKEYYDSEKRKQGSALYKSIDKKDVFSYG